MQTIEENKLYIEINSENLEFTNKEMDVIYNLVLSIKPKLLEYIYIKMTKPKYLLWVNFKGKLESDFESKLQKKIRDWLYLGGDIVINFVNTIENPTSDMTIYKGPSYKIIQHDFPSWKLIYLNENPTSYYISTRGEIKDGKNNKLVHQFLKKDVFRDDFIKYFCNLRIGLKSCTFAVDELVAQTFYKTNQKCTKVQHLDNNIFNNNVENLRCVE